ncbi:hypothetical protein NE637_08375 [Desulfovibrio desulfuricans]|uniref:phage tail assembly chaperone n=1 Tax=Desulfovibrio desulfuricans TaxID=876 RepID=UPI0021095678|nr:hypothetical protein [Desulfovibrio desulfuricans]MCQ4861163.1 hypothetical protein [Desulfovibrio desulfuricans]
MNEVEIQGTVYKIGKLNAFAQMYILKRAAPVLGKLQGVLAAADNKDAKLADVLEPLGAVIGDLPDESLEYVCNAALDVVDMRQAGGGWAPVRSKGQLMYPDMDLLTMLSLTAHVLKDNLTTFFRALPALQAPGQEPKTT